MARVFDMALIQEDFTVGDLAGNREKILQARKKHADVDVLVFSELALCGYPCEDLLYRHAFIEATRAGIDALAQATGDGGPAMIVGAPDYQDGSLFNAAFVLDDGKIQAISHKHELPNYGVFDERRYFTPGPLPGPIGLRGIPIGLMICEDMWQGDSAECLAESGARILCTINASPFSIGQNNQRKTYAAARARENSLPLLYVNQCGAQDELVFDGGSFVLAPDGRLRVGLDFFQPDSARVRLVEKEGSWTVEEGKHHADPEEDTAIYQALMGGLADYAAKSGFRRAVIGLSGGIDSALSAMIAADALGYDNVTGLMMPSPYTSSLSLDDARILAESLGIECLSLPIGKVMEQMGENLNAAFKRNALAGENLQARLRGMILMDFSNSTGALVVSTGNKSEAATGYSTLYGDMCGGLNILKDVYKTQVYRLAHWRNDHPPLDARGKPKARIHASILNREPSAELRPNQKDQDSLPPYDVLDRILQALLEDNRDIEDIVALGLERSLVCKIWQMVARAEYKRRQAPPGIRVSSCLLSQERRYPIVNHVQEDDL